MEVLLAIIMKLASVIDCGCCGYMLTKQEFALCRATVLLCFGNILYA